MENILSTAIEISSPSVPDTVLFSEELNIPREIRMANVLSQLLNRLPITITDEIRVKKLSEAAFDKIPIIKFDIQTHKNNSCTICYCDFEENEDLKKLPCEHLFHEDCIKPWLLNNNLNCPICRADVTIDESDIDISTETIDREITFDD